MRTTLPRSIHKMEDHGFSWLSIVGYIFLTCNSAMAIHNSKGDMGAISFVLVSYLFLSVLFWFLAVYEKGAPDSPGREKLKGVLWFLTTLLACMLSYRLGRAMPLAVALIIWAMTIASSLAVFYAFFLHQESEHQARSMLG